MARQLHLNVFLMPGGHHEGAWRLPGTDPLQHLDMDFYRGMARLCERGLFDAVFIADTLNIPFWDERTASRPAERLDPLLLSTVMASVTSHLGLVATGTATFAEPFTVARSFATLDLISGGRAGWNVVTSSDPASAQNFGLEEIPDHALRYLRAAEFLDVVLGLWGTWRDDVVQADQHTGVYADPSRLRRLDHKGEFFSVRGPLNVGRSPQGHPVIVQAGSSPDGVAFAAKYADVVFTAQHTLEQAKEFYTSSKEQRRQADRDPDGLVIMPGLSFVLGSTEAEASARRSILDSLVPIDAGLRYLSNQTGIPMEELDPDAPLPENVRDPADYQGLRSRYELLLKLARDESLTVRQLIGRMGAGRGHVTFAGTPEGLADLIEGWFRTEAADGFNLCPASLSQETAVFVDHVVPILQRRGLFRQEYAGTTLREQLGLSVPPLAP